MSGPDKPSQEDAKMPSIKIKKLFPDAQLPVRSFETDSGLDLFVYKFEKVYTLDGVSNVDSDCEQLSMSPQTRMLINTGISATVGKGFEIQIRPRSGLALKHGLTVLNTPGTIDEQYRGMIGVILANLSTDVCDIHKGDRIAQMVVAPVVLSEIVEVDELPTTERSAGGFGSSGV